MNKYNKKQFLTDLIANFEDVVKKRKDIVKYINIKKTVILKAVVEIKWKVFFYEIPINSVEYDATLNLYSYLLYKYTVVDARDYKGDNIGKTKVLQWDNNYVVVWEEVTKKFSTIENNELVPKGSIIKTSNGTNIGTTNWWSPFYFI